MNKIKNVLVLVLLTVIAFVLVGCKGNDTPSVPDEPELPAPTEMAVNPIIYKGQEDPYVVVGDKMYLEAVVNEGADDSVEWSIDRVDRASLEEEDGLAVLTGLKGGFVLVTAKSKVDGTITASKKVEVVESENFNDVATQIKNECLEHMPEYADADFKLYTPENDAVKVKYLDRFLVEWKDGIFHYSTNGEYKGVYEGADFVYAFYLVVEYRGATLENTVEIKVVKDAQNNNFAVLNKAADKIVELTQGICEGADGLNTLTPETEGATIISVSGKNLPTWSLPSVFTAAEMNTTSDVFVEWKVETTNAPVIISAATNEQNQKLYRISYSDKPLVNKRVEISAMINYETGKDAENKPIYAQKAIKLYVMVQGYTPEEVLEYFISNKLIPANGTETTSISIPLYTYDKTNKFKLVTIEWKVTDETVMTYVEKSNFLKRVSKGTTTVTGVMYYEKKVNKIKELVTDENGDYVLDEKGNIKYEEVEVLIYAWKQEITLTLTFK